MRAPVKKKIAKPQPKPVRNVDDKLVAMATDSAKQAAESARTSAELAKRAIESNDLTEMRQALVKMTKAITDMTKAMDYTFTPIRVVPKRDSRGVAESWDVLPLRKVH